MKTITYLCTRNETVNIKNKKAERTALKTAKNVMVKDLSLETLNALENANTNYQNFRKELLEAITEAFNALDADKREIKVNFNCTDNTAKIVLLTVNEMGVRTVDNTGYDRALHSMHIDDIIYIAEIINDEF